MEKHAVAFEADNNVGFLKQVVGSLVKRNIQRLAQTYVTLSLEDITRTAGLGDTVEAEKCLVRMIDAVELHTRIDAQVQRCMRLARKSAEVHDRLASDKADLNKVAHKEHSTAGY